MDQKTFSSAHRMNEKFFSYTFTGQQDRNPFSLTVIARSDKEARKRALNSVIVAARKKWIKMGTEPPHYDKERAQLLIDSEPKKFKGTYIPKWAFDQIDFFQGNWCKPVESFFTPIFNDPRYAEKSIDGRTDEFQTDNRYYQLVPFDVWIWSAPVEIHPFDPYRIKMSSCLDG